MRGQDILVAAVVLVGCVSACSGGGGGARGMSLKHDGTLAGECPHDLRKRGYTKLEESLFDQYIDPAEEKHAKRKRSKEEEEAVYNEIIGPQEADAAPAAAPGGHETPATITTTRTSTVVVTITATLPATPCPKPYGNATAAGGAHPTAAFTGAAAAVGRVSMAVVIGAVLCVAVGL